MADVALRAGVSISTVSHVLNGTRKVSPATVRAVEDAVQAVGYTPNILARALARSTTNTIGLALSAVSNHYFSEIVRAIEAECTRHGLMILLTDTHDDPAYELKVVQALHQRRVDGIVLAPAADPEQRVLRYLADNRLPTVSHRPAGVGPVRPDRRREQAGHDRAGAPPASGTAIAGSA